MIGSARKSVPDDLKIEETFVEPLDVSKQLAAPYNFVSWVAISITTIIGLAALTGWSVGRLELATLGDYPTPMRPASALGAVFLSVLVMEMNLGKKRLVHLTSGLIWPVLLFLSWKAFDSLLFFGEFPSLLARFGIASAEETREFIPANVAISYLILDTALFFHTRPAHRKMGSAIAFICALAGICIATLALFGYLADVELAYWWEGDLDCPPNSAFTVLFLAVAIGSTSWSALGASSRRISDIVPLLNLLASAILLSTVLLSACFSILPLYEALLGATYEEVNKSLEKTADEVADFFSSILVATRALPAQTMWEADPTGSPVIAEKRKEEFKRLLDKVNEAFPGVVEMHSIQVSPSGSELPSKLDLPPAPVLPGTTQQPIIWSTREVSGAFRVFVDIPFDDGLPGVVRAEIDLGYLTGLLGRDLGNSGRTGTIYLISAVPGQQPLVLVFSAEEGKLDRGTRSSIPPQLRDALVGAPSSSEASRRTFFRRDRVYLAFPMRNFPALVGFTSRVSPLRTWSNDHLVVVLLGLAFVVVSSTALIFFLMKKLVRQIVLLEERNKRTLGSARTELKLRQEAQIQLESSLHQKELLLKEVHHRVKNNLQVITSILNLQLRRTKDTEAALSLRESSDRIQSIALLHETLYRSENFSQISLTTYLNELVMSIRRSYENGKSVKIDISANLVTADLDRAIPLGLVVTELVTNSFKHAFAATKEGDPELHISITIAATPGDGLVFEYSDNGVGFPSTSQTDSTNKLGLRLIDTLTLQLKGQLKMWSDNGAKVQIVVTPRHSVDAEISESKNSEELNERTSNSDR